MNYVISISGEDYAQLKSFTLFLSKLVFAVDQSKQEEEHEARFRKTLINSEERQAKATFYSEEEYKRLPKLKDGHYRITKDGLHQVRYRKDGYDVQFTSKSLQTVKAEFKAWVQSINEEKRERLPKKTTFGDFAERYFEEVKRANVSAATYKTVYQILITYILPVVGALTFRQITPLKCQSLLNGILDEGKGRTAESVKIILGEVFRAAMGEKLTADNPMLFVKIPKHQRENGTALTLYEIAEFIKACASSPYQKQFMLYLYTGIRRNELHSAIIEGDFIKVACGKCRRGQKQQYRKIPIAPNLRQFLPLSSEELEVKNDVLTGNFKKLCPAHHLYDLRHTFTTRTQESGISKTLVDIWTGHKDNRDMTASVYTHFSAEFQTEEIKKLDY